MKKERKTEIRAGENEPQHTGSGENLRRDGCETKICFRLKAVKEYLARDQTLYGEGDHALRILRAYESVTTSITIREFWEKGDFSYERRG
jgi:hypothetical protein